MNVPLISALMVGALALPWQALADAQGHYGPLPLRKKDAELIEQSGEFADLIARRGHVMESGPEVDLVRRIGQAVAPERTSDDYIDFRFGVVRSAVPNAFALGEGHIFVHTGLLALLENEAQLAAVLAHECMHVEGHHSILNARQSRKKVGGMRALGIVLGDIGQLANIFILKAMIGYGRALEEEADMRGVERLLAAGYDPRVMPRVFELLDEDPEGLRPPAKPKWSSHPLAVARSEYLRRWLENNRELVEAEERRRGGLIIGDEGYTQAVAGAARDSVRQWIAGDHPRTALVRAQRLLELWPEDARVHALVGEAWRALDTRNPEPTEGELTKRAKKHRVRKRVQHTPEEREALRRTLPAAEEQLEHNEAEAERAYLRALELEPEQPDALRGMALLRERQGELLDAGRHLARYLRAAPDALDHAVMVRKLARLTERIDTP